MFLLSAKTTTQEYAFSCSFPVSINGGPAQSYGSETPFGTVKPGDVLTWTEAGGDDARFEYFGGSGQLEFYSSRSPYTVQAVPGATMIEAIMVVS